MAADTYAVLAQFYEPLGMSTYALAASPRLVQYAQQNDWLGRRIIDFGCGTGGSVRWLASQGYNITAIDSSPTMLLAARNSIDSRGLALQWVEGDAHAMQTFSDCDMVLAIDVLNEMGSLRELEQTLACAAQALAPEKWLIFDLHTLEGLADVQKPTQIIRADDDFTAIVTSSYDHERQTRTEQFLLFHAEGGLWQRQQAVRALRGFPTQVVTTLLTRTGFELIDVVAANTLAPVPMARPTVPRVVCFARRNA